MLLGGTLQAFTELRRKLKAELEKERLLGTVRFNLWINEDAPSWEGSLDVWESCLEQVR